MPRSVAVRRVVVGAVAVAVIGVGAALAPATDPATGAAKAATDLPLTFDGGRGAGRATSTGDPRATPSTGRLAVPSGYAPPCVEPFTGDNGGETAPGVTGDTITIVLYQAQPDLLEQTFFEETGSDESLATERDTTQQYVDYFSAHYELYGRKVELVTLKASGAPDDDVAAKADAIKAATELGAFASFGGPGQTDAYAEELRGTRRAVRRRLPHRAAPGVPGRAPAAPVADAGVTRAGLGALGRVRRHAAEAAARRSTPATTSRRRSACSGSCTTTTTRARSGRA